MKCKINSNTAKQRPWQQNLLLLIIFYYSLFLFVIIWQFSHLIVWLEISADAHPKHRHLHYAKLSLINNSASFGESFFNYGDEWKCSIWWNDNYLWACCKVIIFSCCPGLISSGCITPLLPISSPCALWVFLNGTPTLPSQTLISACIHTVILAVMRSNVFSFS